MYTPRDYLLKHKIIKLLVEKRKLYDDSHKGSKHNPFLLDVAISYVKLSETLKVSMPEFEILVNDLIKDDVVVSGGVAGSKYLYSNENAPIFLLTKKYIKEGNSIADHKIYNKTRWLIPVASFIISVISIIYSFHKIPKLEDRVKILEKELNELSNKENTSSQTQIHPLPHIDSSKK